MKIMIADDHAVVRSGLKYILEAQPDFEVVADAADGTEAFMLLEHQPVDVALMDWRMPPGENGLQTTKRILTNFPEVKVIILSMHEEEDYVQQAFANGASGYVLKSSSDKILIQAIRDVAVGKRVVDPFFKGVQIPTSSETAIDVTSGYSKLSKREREVLPLIALGYSNKQIAARLFLSVKTVEVHKAHIMKKLGVKNFAELLQYCVKHHLIDL